MKLTSFGVCLHLPLAFLLRKNLASDEVCLLRSLPSSLPSLASPRSVVDFLMEQDRIEKAVVAKLENAQGLGPCGCITLESSSLSHGTKDTKNPRSRIFCYFRN